MSVLLLLLYGVWAIGEKGLICSECYGSQRLPLNKLLSAAHIIRLSGEIVRLWGGREKRNESFWENKISQ